MLSETSPAATFCEVASAWPSVSPAQLATVSDDNFFIVKGRGSCTTVTGSAPTAMRPGTTHAMSCCSTIFDMLNPHSASLLTQPILRAASKAAQQELTETLLRAAAPRAQVRGNLIADSTLIFARTCSKVQAFSMMRYAPTMTAMLARSCSSPGSVHTATFPCAAKSFFRMRQNLNVCPKDNGP
eukprot:CAMPEP_0178413160 /NCGR_PEP_ID=MMETSP0689_2-20121128/22386_1 /TAXON_ID=160604 /ORGANISM="Amphidinium massartii, Strain CS-259" /LENGTH=183 /DNA_ID=CAMNT_0020034427 /DNA_START=711 /DNA_END=1263 /DNA_ORIENTATION=+